MVVVWHNRVDKKLINLSVQCDSNFILVLFSFSSFLFIFILFSLFLDIHGVWNKENNLKITDIYICTRMH